MEGLAADGSTAGIQAGEILTVDQLLQCMLIISANEACNILAEQVSGSVDAFVDAMNAKAEALGCEDTHFANASGLHNSQHYTTAWDLYRITAEAMKHEDFMRICDTARATIPATNLSGERNLYTTNYLIDTWRSLGYVYSNAHGIKTGSTDEAGHCLVSSATDGSLSFVSVALGGPRVTLEDGEIRTYSFFDTREMFMWAFDNFSYQTVLEGSELVKEVSVALSQVDHVSVHPASDVELLLPNGTDPATLERRLDLESPVDAPITEGQALGTLTLLSPEGEELATVDLLASHDVEASGLLLELVNEVLDMGKLESGEVVLENVPFDLPELMHEITDVLEKQAAERGIVLHREYGRLPHPRLVGSPLHVKRLLMNVLSNAIKYNREKGRVMLDCFELSSNGDKAQICFVCADTGIGMSEEFQKRMFEPFTQENAGARSVYGGTGLGMSIAKSLVDKMGGTIGVESKQGVGTTYTITLPFAIDNTATEEPERQQTDLTVLQGRRMLLAEDNALNMEIMEFLLNDVGVKVTKAADGQQAVEAFAASPPGGFDAILMDVMMPVRDGHEATRAIRAMDRPDAKTIPIFAMTANAFTEDRRKALESGMNEHLSKPIDPDALYRLLVKYLTERS